MCGTFYSCDPSACNILINLIGGPRPTFVLCARAKQREYSSYMSTQTHARFSRVCCLCESVGRLVHLYANVFSFIFTSCEYPIRVETNQFGCRCGMRIRKLNQCLELACSSTNQRGACTGEIDNVSRSPRHC